MRFFLIEPANVALFIKQVGPHEEIRPVPQADDLGVPTGKFILQEDLAASGPAYAAEVAMAHYTTHAIKVAIMEEIATQDGEGIETQGGQPIIT